MASGAAAEAQLFVLNRDLGHGLEATVESWRSGQPVEAVTLNAAGLMDSNSFEQPDHVHLVRSAVVPGSSTFPYRFPAHSITLLKR